MMSASSDLQFQTHVLARSLGAALAWGSPIKVKIHFKSAQHQEEVLTMPGLLETSAALRLATPSLALVA
ncbi:MAG: hypothetical protein NW237_13995 [Cyanobacteriota bacterium]|nr:hypothetical protein [Cyanobacteriota bacterium]